MDHMTASLALNQVEQTRLRKQMSLIRGNRRSTSKHNSMIDPIEELKGEAEIFRNDFGEYIEPVPEETYN